jgi:hypothetical protein
MWHFLNTVKRSDIVKGIYAWREASMQTEDLVVDKGGEGQVVEEICEILPYICVAVFSKTFVIESVDLGDLAGFVVATENGNALRITDFEGNEESNGFD